LSTTEKAFALALGVVALIAIYLLRPILTPFVLGIVLDYLGDPVVDYLERRGRSRTTGALIVFATFALCAVGALLVLLPLVVLELVDLVGQIPAWIDWLQGHLGPFLAGVDPIGIDPATLKSHLAEHWAEAGSFLGDVIREVTASSLALVSAVSSIALTPVVAFYLMRDWDAVMQGLREMIPRDQEKPAVALVRECDEVLSSFLRGQMMVMLLLGVMYSIGLMAIGLDTALLIGLTAGLASIVPYLGFAVGIVAALLAAVFQFQDVLHPALVVAVFMAGQLIESFVLTPWFVGDRIGLHPVAVIFAVLAGGQLFGFVGVLIALPAAAVLMVFVRHLRARYLASAYYGVAASGMTVDGVAGLAGDTGEVLPPRPTQPGDSDIPPRTNS